MEQLDENLVVIILDHSCIDSLVITAAFGFKGLILRKSLFSGNSR